MGNPFSNRTNSRSLAHLTQPLDQVEVLAVHFLNPELGADAGQRFI